jgi:hypothetical protein
VQLAARTGETEDSLMRAKILVGSLAPFGGLEEAMDIWSECGWRGENEAVDFVSQFWREAGQKAFLMLLRGFGVWVGD